MIDVLDPTMKDAESVAAAFTFPVLAVIPYVKPREQTRLASAARSTRRRGPGSASAAGGGAAVQAPPGRGTASRAR